MNKMLVWGCTGQFRVLRPLLQAWDLYLFDQDALVQGSWPSSYIEHSMDIMLAWVSRNPGAMFTLAMGGVRGKERCELAELLVSKHLEAAPPLYHPRAWIAASAKAERGCQILGMAAISEYVVIGAQTIVNTSASVDHDCVLGNGVHVMPGATLAGQVIVEDFASIGSGAVVLPRVRIGKSAIVGAGAVVVEDVPEGITVVGVPAKAMPPKHVE